MCEIECFGNYHRGCEVRPLPSSRSTRNLTGRSRARPQHYVKLYESGNKTDCGSPGCALSAAHKHRPGQRTCTCSKMPRECRRVLSLIHERCDNCTRAAWATFERESGRVW
ncbi:hypothetical protein C8Q80DRAFT_514399 [Daedaleopsis nitida]|nr:hypothetical protein C8Q80DRAFT_514399 [Daedaleopsis nitida]